MATKAKKISPETWRSEGSIYIDGKRNRKSFSADRAWKAEQLAEEWEKTGKTDAKKLTLARASEQYIEANRAVLSPTTILEYESHSRNHFKELMNRDIYTLTRDDFQREVSAMTSSPKTRKNIAGFFITVLRYYIPELPPMNLKYPPQKKKKVELPPLSKIQELLDHIRDTDLYLPVLMMITLGLRKSELLGLRYEDISGEYLTINRVMICGSDYKPTIKDTPKTAAGMRTIAIPPKILDLISDKQKTSESDYIITMSTQYLSRHLIAAEKEIGIDPPITAHKFRHYSVSILHALNVPKSYGMRRIGHITEEMYDRRYDHEIPEYQKEIDTQINAALENIFFSKNG